MPGTFQGSNTTASTTAPGQPYVAPELVNLANFLEGRSGRDILRHFFGFKFHPYPKKVLDEAIFVGIDTEWWEHDPHPTTEVGISSLYPHSIMRYPGFHAEFILKNIGTHHIRITEYAHLVNSFPGAGDPERFHYGKTVFLTTEETRQALYKAFTQKGERGTLRPIIFIGHDTSGDFVKIKEDLGVDIMQFGSVVKIIDTQQMASEMGIMGTKGPKISLKELAQYFLIDPVDLHQAGNDIANIMFVAVLMSLRDELYWDYRSEEARRFEHYHMHYSIRHNVPEWVLKRPTGPREVGPRTIKEVLQHVADLGRLAISLTPLSDRFIFCIRCGQEDHGRLECKALVLCAHCCESRLSRHRLTAHTHMTERCIFNVSKPIFRQS